MATASSEKGTLRFGVFELHPHTGELRKSGHKIALRPQAAKVLAALASRPGELLTREQLKDEVWGRETFVDLESGLNLCIRQIRAALCDDADTPRYIETLPRRGYRFIMPVERVASEPASGSGQAAAASATDTFRLRSLRFPALVALGAVALVLLVWAGLGRGHVGRQNALAMAVLPFQNLSGDSEDSYLSSGLTEEMITTIAQVRPEQLRVIARTSSMTYSGSDKSAAQIGHELGADYLLEGSVQRNDGRVRVHAQLIRVKDQSHVWAQSYDTQMSDLLTLERDLADSIARQVELRLTGQAGPRVTASQLPSPEAHEAYLRGRYHLRKLTREGDDKAIELFNQAIAASPNYALAYVGLAEAEMAESAVYRAPLQTMPAARSAAEKAIALDDSLAEAHATMGIIKLMYDWDWTGAEQEFHRAIELDPNSAVAHVGYAQYFAITGQKEQAVRESHLASTLDPLNSILTWNYYVAGSYEDAIRQCKGLIELQPSYGLAYSVMGLSYSAEARQQEAIEAAEHARQLSDTPLVQIEEAVVYAKAGRRAAAEQVLSQLTAEQASEYVCSFNLAALYAVLGRKDDAFAALEKGYLQRSD